MRKVFGRSLGEMERKEVWLHLMFFKNYFQMCCFICGYFITL